MVENATRTAWIRASNEILEKLQREWSVPVQVHATQNTDGSWEMTFRTYSHRARVIRAAQALMRQSDVMMEHNGVLYLMVSRQEVQELRDALNALWADNWRFR